jgi:hypothetical protein
MIPINLNQVTDIKDLNNDINLVLTERIIVCKESYSDDEEYDYFKDKNIDIEKEICRKSGVIFSFDDNFVVVSFDGVKVDLPRTIFSSNINLEIGLGVVYKICEDSSGTRYQKIEKNENFQISEQFKKRQQDLISFIDSI